MANYSTKESNRISKESETIVAVERENKRDVKAITANAIQALKDNNTLPICLIGVFITRAAIIVYNNVILLWLLNFAETGEFKNNTEA